MKRTTLLIGIMLTCIFGYAAHKGVGAYVTYQNMGYRDRLRLALRHKRLYSWYLQTKLQCKRGLRRYLQRRSSLGERFQEWLDQRLITYCRHRAYKDFNALPRLERYIITAADYTRSLGVALEERWDAWIQWLLHQTE